MEIQKLKGHIPDSVLSEISSLEKFSINTPLRLSHFISQIYHESNKFTCTEENLYYTDPLRVCKVFRKFDLDKDRVIDQEEIEFAKGFLRQPEKLANFVYANRMGNGDVASGSGWKHRGFGYIQTTGTENQQAFFKAIEKDINTDPKEIATKYPLLSAGYFWKSIGLNEMADKGVMEVDEITKKVNGGLTGLDERVKYFNKFYDLLK